MQILKSILGSIFALMIFAFVWFLSDLALKLLDSLRNNRNFIQYLFRTLFTPGVGAYFAMLMVDKVFKTYNKNIVFYSFSSILMLFTTRSLYIMIPVATQAEFTSYDFSMQVLTPIVAIVTAYLQLTKDKRSKKRFLMVKEDLAQVILYNDKHKVFLQQRDNKAPENPNTIGLFGGGIKNYETPRCAVRRECYEETSYTLKTLRKA